MVLKVKKRKGRQVACKWCNQEMNTLGMSAHLQWQCEMRPTMEDAGEMRPGMVVNEGTGMPQKIAWTWSDLEKIYPKGTWKTFISSRTCPITWNGLRVQVIDGQEATIPPIHYDILMESIALDRDITSIRQESDIVGRMGAELKNVGRGPLQAQDL